MYTRIGLEMSYGPQQVHTYSIVNSDIFIGGTFASDFGVKIVEGGSKQREHIKAPIDPSRKSLPFM